MSKLVSMIYKLARAANDISKVASGNAGQKIKL